jgi:hypothetical protein
MPRVVAVQLALTERVPPLTKSEQVGPRTARELTAVTRWGRSAGQPPQRRHSDANASPPSTRRSPACGVLTQVLKLVARVDLEESLV